MASKTDNLKAVLEQIWSYARQVPGLVKYLEDNKNSAIQIVRDLARINKGFTLSEWKDLAHAKLTEAGIRGEREWQEILINLGYETIKGEVKRNWFVRFFLKISDFLVRYGLKEYVQKNLVSAVKFLTEEATRPGITFAQLKTDVFDHLKAYSPESPDTWVAFTVSIASSVLKSRFPQFSIME